MKFLLGQHLFNNIFCTTWIFPYPRNNQENIIKDNWIKQNKINCIQENWIKLKLNKIKDKFNGIQVTNFHNRST